MKKTNTLIRRAMIGTALMLPCVLPAATLTWVGADGGGWGIATNWNNGTTSAVPVSTDLMNISNSTAASIATGTTAVGSRVLIGSTNGTTGGLNITGGSLTLSGGTGAGLLGLAATSNGASSATVNQSGGTVSVTTIQFGTNNVSKTGAYNLSGGTLSISGLTELGRVGTSNFTQTGGDMTTGSLSIVSDVATTAVTTAAKYSVSGGTLSVTGNLTNNAVVSANAGTANATFQVIGSTATINVGGNYVTGTESATRHATLDVKMDNGGLSKINLTGSGTATLAGTLSAGFKGGVALTTGTSFSVLEANTGQISGSFSTNPSTSLWAASSVQAVSGSRDALVLSYAGSANKTTLSVTGTASGSFTAATMGYATFNSVTTGAPVSVYLDASAGTGKVTSDLLSFFTDNGITAVTSDLGGYSVRLTLTSITSTAYFGWDLTKFNSDATISGISIQQSSIPEPSMSAVIFGIGCLGWVVGRRRSRS
jgi:hypothetical protein